MGNNYRRANKLDKKLKGLGTGCFVDLGHATRPKVLIIGRYGDTLNSTYQ